MKTLLSAALVATFALSVLAVAPAARADPVVCTVEQGGIPPEAVDLFSEGEGDCSDLDVCMQGGAVVVGFTSRDPAQPECYAPVAAIQATPLECGATDGYTVTVTVFGPSPLFPVTRSQSACVPGIGPPPQLLAPCGFNDQGTAVVLPNGNEVICLDPSDVPDLDPTPCYHLTDPIWVGVDVVGTCTAVGLCQYSGNTSVGVYRNGALQQCLPVE